MFPADPLGDFDHLTNGHGSVVLGWVDHCVMYARFEGSVCADLAAQFTAAFMIRITNLEAVRYFADSSALASYDMVAMAAVLDSMLAKRRQFKLVTVLPWQGSLSGQAERFAAAFGCFEFAQTAASFNARLEAAAPLAAGLVRQLRSRLNSATQPEADVAASQALAMYSFDLTQFESGHLTATRLPRGVAPTRGGWLCLARDDQHALELAHRAAFTEWARPAKRRPDDFLVRFVSAPGGR